MGPSTRSARRATATAALLLLSAGSVAALKSRYKPHIPDAPAYRTSGPADAEVVLVEFSDFQCPACGAVLDTLQGVKKLHHGRIRVVFKHLAWPFHRFAKPAAVLAECAGKQGKFWETHDLLFARQGDWGLYPRTGEEDAAFAAKVRELFAGYARELKLEPQALEACTQDPATAAVVDAEFREARESFIGGTPTLFINGRRFVGPKPIRNETLREVERILGKARS
ncbi:MAG: DsbA family protein [Elusimicrobia bacterium]|nr:DsbA family protein [Elusimicrobiota bacterium]